jgi:integrase/recombinase XerD
MGEAGVSRTTKKPKPRTRRPPEALKPEEAVAIIRKCSRRAPTGIRNAALFALLYSGGLRLGEALALRPSDVDHEHCTVHVRHGKGDKDRLVKIGPQACAYLERWLEKRRQLGLSRRRQPSPTEFDDKGRPVTASHIFTTLAGDRVINPRYVREALKRAAERAGIDKHVHPHGLRHTLAAQLANEGVPVHHIQEQLGHASLNTTAVYLKRIAPKERLDAIAGHTWAADQAPAPDPLEQKIAALTEQLDELRREAAARKASA